jgi:hypothetical protein
VPDSAIPDQPPLTTVPGRDFGHPGTLPVGADHDTAATFAILYGAGDTPADWLRAGEALSAAWLAATELGVAVLPLSATVEIPATRLVLRRLVANLGAPYLVLRLGFADPDHPAAPAADRADHRTGLTRPPRLSRRPSCWPPSRPRPGHRPMGYRPVPAVPASNRGTCYRCATTAAGPGHPAVTTSPTR